MWIGELALARSIPRAPVMTAIGVLFLVLSRRVWRAPGSSLALAAVASAFKFLQHPVWGCKVAAVLMVGAVFDLGFTLYEARRARARSTVSAPAGAPIVGTTLIAALATFASFVLFAYFARDVLHNPYWGIPEKMTDYMFVQGPIAALLSLPAAVAGSLAADRLLSAARAWANNRWIVLRAVALGSGAAGVASALILRY